MNSALITLGIVAVLGLAASGGLGVEASVESAEFDLFVTRGFVALSGISTEAAVAVANHHGGSKYQKRIFSLTCNDEPFEGTECIGQLIVNSTVVKSDDEVFYEVRYCNGKFTNKTMPKMDGKMDSEQICKGKNYLYMKDMKKCNETGEWMTKYFFSKSCFSKYSIVIEHLPPIIEDTDKIKVATYCETAAETIRFDKDKEQWCGSDKKGCVDIPATCNCETTSIDEPCEGRFKIVMDKKPSSNYGRKLSEANGHSEESMNKNWTFICDGKWIPYNGTFFECEGIKQEYSEMEYYNFYMSRNCTGIFGTSMFNEKSGGYKLCNGMNDFQHTMSIPIASLTT